MYTNINLETIFKKYIDKIDHPIIAIETGCSYAWEDINLPYLSTPCILKHLIAPTGGILYSLDNDINNIDKCRNKIRSIGFDGFVKFIHGDSVDSINRLDIKNVNFVWLDSSENSDHAMSEYESVKKLLSRKYIICVDDYGCQNSVKWQWVSNTIKETFNNYDTYTTPTGLIVGYMGDE